MRCIVVHQPYASLIIEGIKDVENRSWQTPYRGSIAILAGKSTQWIECLDSESKDKYWKLLKCPLYHLPFGALIGTVELYDIVTKNVMNSIRPDSIWTFGPQCWLLRNPLKLVTPIPYRGQQGLFNIPDDSLEEGINTKLT